MSKALTRKSGFAGFSSCWTPTSKGAWVIPSTPPVRYDDSGGIDPPPNFWSQTWEGTPSSDGRSFDTIAPNEGAFRSGNDRPARSMRLAMGWMGILWLIERITQY